MNQENYDKRANILNQIAQHTDTINKLSMQLQEIDNIEFRYISKLHKSLSLLNYFVINERKFMKQVRNEYYKSIIEK